MLTFCLIVCSLLQRFSNRRIILIALARSTKRLAAVSMHRQYIASLQVALTRVAFARQLNLNVFIVNPCSRYICSSQKIYKVVYICALMICCLHTAQESMFRDWLSHVFPSWWKQPMHIDALLLYGELDIIQWLIKQDYWSCWFVFRSCTNSDCAAISARESKI